MVGTSKILTVSYGTFSCTLEGFDDSFSTMKAIAEYFRGLAADDRYFGAEPPTPDADMLAQIAEREISRRVEARTDESGIVLRAAALTDQSEQDDEKAARAHDADSRAAVDAARKAAKAERKAAKKAERKARKEAQKAAEKAKAKAHAAEMAAEQAKSEDAAHSADKAQDTDASDADTSDTDILSSVSAATAAQTEGTAGSNVEETRDIAPSSVLAATDPAPENTADLPQADQAEGHADDTDTADDMAADPSEPYNTGSPDPIPAHPDRDSVAAKLQRIRAVVGKPGDAGSIGPAMGPANGDLTEQFLPQSDTPDVADVRAQQTPEVEDPVAEFDAHEAEMAQDAIADQSDQEGASDHDNSASSDTSPDAAGGPDMIARVMAKGDRTDRDHDLSKADMPDDMTSDDATDDSNKPTSNDTSETMAEAAAKSAPKARVVRMKRADFEKAVEEGQFEMETAPEPSSDDRAKKADQDANTGKSSGPDLGLLDGADDLDDYLEDSDFTQADDSFDDADLADELAAIEADYDADDTEATQDVADDDAAPMHITPDAPNRQDAAAMDETDGQSRQNTSEPRPLATDEADDQGSDDQDVEDQAADDERSANIAALMAANAASAPADPNAPDVSDSIEEDEPDQVDDRATTGSRTGDTKSDDVPSRGFMAEDPDVDDAALDRLMSETDAQMQEPEGSRRRDAIAQLKAAVAAKEAARQVGEAEDDGQDVENAFRNDLSEAVRPEGTPRPRPVVRTGTRTERPRPAPLKLVAAQRVDIAPAEPRDGPVVPRRVTATHDETSAQSAGSFAEFAENMGASDLPDLLEAAAAYTAFVEGADEFSRPQIMRRVRAVSSDDFNREDGLRSFADLLRAGRFTKVRNGRFQVADDSRYNPERRAS